MMLVEDGTGASWKAAAGEPGSGTRGMGPDTPAFLASITKLYTAAVLLRLAERGAVDLDLPMADYLRPEIVHGLHILNGSDNTRAITVRNQLEHTSGLPDYFTDRPRGGRSLAEQLSSEGDRSWILAEVAARVRTELQPHFLPQPKDARKPRIRYSDTNYQLLGAIVESVAGAPFYEVLAREILVPLGLGQTYIFPHRRSDPEVDPARIWIGDAPRDLPLTMGSFGPDGGIVAPLEEAATFIRSLMNGRVFERAETLEAMFTRWNRFGLPLDRVALQLPSWPVAYGAGIMRFQLPPALNGFRRMPAVFGHSGSTGAWLFYCPELDVVLAGTVNQATAGALPYRVVPRLLRALDS